MNHLNWLFTIELEEAFGMVDWNLLNISYWRKGALAWKEASEYSIVSRVGGQQQEE